MSRYQKGLLGFIAVMVLAFAANIAFSAYAQQVKRNQAKKTEETYTRPKPTKPIKPVIPSQDRYQSDKVFLENAEVLYKTQNWGDTVDRQIVSGNVKFRQGSLWMFCDSAYYYPEINSLDAFGNIRMEQGDTLFVYADKLFYNGNDHFAKLTHGPSEPKVRLKDPSGELLTDTLDYDVDLGIGFYGCGGLLKDEVNTLTSQFGQYNSKTKDADFFYDVELVNKKDDFTLLSDTLYYNTSTHIAKIVSPTDIYGPNDTIYTSNGWYNTELSNLEMTHRSTLIHKDSLGRATTLVGDSIVYDNATRISRAYQYRDIKKPGQPTVLTDTANKMILISGFGMYNDSTKEAFATEYPLLKEYSRQDTIYLRADTIFTYILQDTIWTTQAEIDREKRREAYIADFEYLEWPHTDEDLMAPISPEEMLRIMLVYYDQRPDPVPEQSNDNLPASIAISDPNDILDTITATDSIVVPDSVEINDSIAVSDSIEKNDSIVMQDSVAMDVSDKQAIEVSNPPLPKEPEKILKGIREFHMAKTYPRSRFFSVDVQGVADTLEFWENDSLMYMKRKPVVWSGERQITGNKIILHFNDTTVDYANLPDFGFMAEHVEEDFYNQLAGKKMEAWFEDDYLKRLYVEGNVQTIMLPMENDSSYNKMVDAESSHMTVDMKDRKIEKVKMWPEVTGNTTPLFLVKRAQKYLPTFRWLEAIRPKRVVIDGTLRWEDELGEISDELELYFETN